MRHSDQDEFYIGYDPPKPRRMARFVTRAVLLIGALAALTAVLVAVGHKSLEAGTFEYGHPTSIAGTLLERPYPALIPDGARSGDASVLLVAPGKHGADRLVQGAGERPAQTLVRSGLELAGAPALADRRRAQRVEQDRLADPAKPGEHQGSLRSPLRHALEYDVERGQLLVAPGQFGRALACARGVRVADRVHDQTLSACIGKTLDFVSEPQRDLGRPVGTPPLCT